MNIRKTEEDNFYFQRFVFHDTSESVIHCLLYERHSRKQKFTRSFVRRFEKERWMNKIEIEF